MATPKRIGAGRSIPAGPRLIVVFLLALFSTAALHAQAPPPLPQPNVAIFSRGVVHALVRLDDGSVIVGGSFSSVYDPVSGLNFQRDNLAKIGPNGGVDLTWNPATDGTVETLAVDASGAVILGGSFRTVNGVARDRIARVASVGAGALDADWNPAASGIVLALAVDSLGRIYVGGNFSFIGGLERSRLARIDATGVGAADPDWNVLPFASVFALAIDASDRLYAGGIFQTISGIPRNRLARLITAGGGTVDPDWNPNSSGDVHALALAPEGLYVGGTFISIGGLRRDGLARVSTGTTATVDATWTPSPAAFSNVYALAHAAPDTLVVGGLFTTIGGQPRARLAKVSTLGTGAAVSNWQPDADSDVNAIVVLDNGDVFAGGAFGDVAGEPSLGLVRVSAAGQVLSAPTVQRGGSASAVLRAPDGHVYVGGGFQVANGLRRRNLLRLAPDGTLDTAWNPDANAAVAALALDSSGALYVGGDFTVAGGQPRQCLARVAPGATGTVDAAWDPAITAQFSCNLRALATDASDRVYVGGYFNGIGGVARNYVARLNPGATVDVDAGWNPNADFIVHEFELDGAGQVYVGGQFSVIGGQPRRMIAKLSTLDGSADATWNPDASSASSFRRVVDIALDADGSVYVGGDFDTIGGQPRSYVAKLSSTGVGAADPNWNPGANAAVEALVLDGTGALFVGGSFDTLGAMPRSGLAKLSTAAGAALDPLWNPTPNGNVFGLARSPDGTLYAAGNFVAIGAQGRRLIAALPPIVDAVFADGFE